MRLKEMHVKFHNLFTSDMERVALLKTEYKTHEHTHLPSIQLRKRKKRFVRLSNSLINTVLLCYDQWKAMLFNVAYLVEIN